jgi:hypothetical protein
MTSVKSDAQTNPVINITLSKSCQAKKIFDFVRNKSVACREPNPVKLLTQDNIFLNHVFTRGVIQLYSVTI